MKFFEPTTMVFCCEAESGIAQTKPKRIIPVTISICLEKHRRAVGLKEHMSGWMGVVVLNQRMDIGGSRGLHEFLGRTHLMQVPVF